MQWAGLKCRKNGELLRRAEESGYDLLLTVDQGIAYQQRLFGKKIAILAIRARSNRMQDLLPMVYAINRAIGAIRPGELLRVE